MDLKNITVEDLKEKLAADKKTLIKFELDQAHSFPYNLFAILRPMVNEKKQPR